MPNRQIKTVEITSDLTEEEKRQIRLWDVEGHCLDDEDAIEISAMQREQLKIVPVRDSNEGGIWLTESHYLLDQVDNSD